MTRIFKNYFISALLFAAAAGAASMQVAEKKTLTLEGARKVIAAAEAEAKRLNAPSGVIAVVDDGGNLMALERLDNSFAAGANISTGKARTAALFKMPSKNFEEIIAKGRTAMVAVAEVTPFTPLQGGEPIVIDGQIVGAIGVSGAANAAQDEQLAIAGVKAFEGISTALSISPTRHSDCRSFSMIRERSCHIQGCFGFATGSYSLSAGISRDPTVWRSRPTSVTSMWTTGTPRRRSSCATRSSLTALLQTAKFSRMPPASRETMPGMA